MITRLIGTLWTSLSAVPRKAVKFNHSLIPTPNPYPHPCSFFPIRIHTHLAGWNFSKDFPDQGLFSISYLESSNLASNLALSSILSNLGVQFFFSLMISFFKWLRKSLGPKSLCLFWDCTLSFSQRCVVDIRVNTIVTPHVNTIMTSLNAAP